MSAFARRTALLLAAITMSAPIAAPAAGAAPCPDVEIVFARGTTEPPGVGGIGQAFVDSVRSRLGDRSVGVYAVDYPASRDFAVSTRAGAEDTRAHVQSTAVGCPATQMVLGGYSQGAAVMDVATAAMPPTVAPHVVAVALFGGPRSSFADRLAPGPLPSVGPEYAAKTIDLCVPNDPICFEGGRDMGAHVAYVEAGLVNQAAEFAAGRI
ncbi:cutinase [Mycobacterium sp. GA-1285]|uniref:cutinase family protein n=1 Tax=Mycobacterium sp. GA-1285 TaxID=1772282 RepID=UPI0007475904|nr:cutinase family protein [Mycobacterium sp. GA-1285]KUI20768.1 cutinase [Mycobacterium sp. GA-1285]